MGQVQGPRTLGHPGVELRANLESISHRGLFFEVAFVWDLTEETMHLPLSCLQGVELVLALRLPLLRRRRFLLGVWGSGAKRPHVARVRGAQAAAGGRNSSLDPHNPSLLTLNVPTRPSERSLSNRALCRFLPGIERFSSSVRGPLCTIEVGSERRGADPPCPPTMEWRGCFRL